MIGKKQRVPCKGRHQKILKILFGEKLTKFKSPKDLLWKDRKAFLQNLSSRNIKKRILSQKEIQKYEILIQSIATKNM